MPFTAPAQKTVTSKYLSFNNMVNFWNVYDKVISIKDSAEQIKIIQQGYFKKASYELRLMLPLLGYTASDYLAYIRAYPRFWKGLRERSISLIWQHKEIERSLKKLKRLHRSLEIPDVDFMVGRFEFGGKPFMNHVMIAVEVASADGNLDIPSSDYDSQLYSNYAVDAVTYFILHETIHTMQPDFSAQDLLSLCIMEGSCDFIAEIVIGKPLNRPYIILGNKSEEKIWEAFKKQMNGFNYEDWLYNKGFVVRGQEDLGYFMGYAICKYYFEHAKNKKKAIRRIINLNYMKNTEVYKFFLETGYENKFAGKF